MNPISIRRTLQRRGRRAAAFLAGGLTLAAPAQADNEPAKTAVAATPVVVTATRIEQPTFDLPVSIDVVERETIQAQKAGANVSEVLGRVPGTVVQNRETYSQEQQIVIRGFGARSQFGVRGVRLIADGIPASTPDGQGGSGLFDLASARRIEVLRGPFSALYGNHSGGVVQVFTEDGPKRPTLTGNFAAGSYGTWKAGAKYGGQQGALNYNLSLSRFETDGYRQWSQARKDQLNAKLRYQVDATSAWTVVANTLDQPDNLDPLGLTAAQVAADRRQAQPGTAPPTNGAVAFRTRRSLSNLQGGLAYETAVGDRDTLRATAYNGSRRNEQFLAIAANGVSTIDRDFYGAGLRWTRQGEHLTITAGADYENAEDLRQGFANVGGSKGALSRDEVNSVDQAGAYAQAEWRLNPALSLSGGLRYTRVSFDSSDHFLSNGDNSGTARYSSWTPAVGVLWKLSESANFYANAGRSFETPTFIELSFRPNGAPGLNFELRPSRSNHYEAGIKAFVGANTRVNLAVFRIDTRDEIVVATNAGGRTTYQNAGDTRRHGVELAVDADLGSGLNTYVAATWLSAKFQDRFLTCGGVTPPCPAPSVAVGAGNRIPGVPNYQVSGELAWRHAPLGFSAALEGRWTGKVQVNDVNSATADRYFVANLRAGFEQQIGPWRLNEFARVDNLFDEKYIGAVYVNDANSRFFAPAPERNYLIGVSASHRF